MAGIIPPQPWGASADEWAHFDMVLGLTADLLPVVSNPRATISPDSHMAALGKTPSRYNAQRLVAGIAKWTQHTTTPNEIAQWAKERDYGICIQTRTVRAIDIDIGDAGQAAAIAARCADAFAMPARFRSNSTKVLLAFEARGDLTKRRFKTAHGIVELLATGQQFVACGTHPSGARYEWRGGLPDDLPALTIDEVGTLWSALVAEFAIEAPSESSSSVKAQKLAEVVALDATAQHLLDKGLVKRTERDGRLHITCPFEAEHTADSGDTATTYWPAHTGGYALGHFRCLHAHCEHRSDQDFRDAIGFEEEPILGEFQAIADEKNPAEVARDGVEVASTTTELAPGEEPAPIVKPLRFAVQPAHLFAAGAPPAWLIEHVMPKAELGVLYGESGAGKSFAVMDLAFAVALGQPWREQWVDQGRVVYVAAEGAGGVKLRLRAIAQQRGLDLAAVPVGVIGDAPNMMEKADALDLARSIVASGGGDLVILDTFAASMQGNENSGEDVGRVLAHCKGIHKATGAMVLLIHHSGKDATRGARGWSGIKGAVDVELEVVRSDEARSLTVTKLKDGQGEGKEYAFRLESVVLGLDARGNEITSCVVSHGEGRVRGMSKKGPRGMHERMVANGLNELGGLTLEPVERVELIAWCIEQTPRGDAKRDRREETIVRALEGLIEDGKLQRVGTKVGYAPDQ